MAGRSGDWSGVASSDAHKAVDETYAIGSNYAVLQIWIADHDGQIDIAVGNRYYISAHPDYVTLTSY